MIFKIDISEQADADLRNIYEYIAFELQSSGNASAQLDHLEESIMSLDHMPERFRKYENEPWHGRNLRFMPVDNYCVLYLTDIKEALVTIIHVMYQGRNIDVQLTKYTKQ